MSETEQRKPGKKRGKSLKREESELKQVKKTSVKNPKNYHSDAKPQSQEAEKVSRPQGGETASISESSKNVVKVEEEKEQQQGICTKDHAEVEGLDKPRQAFEEDLLRDKEKPPLKADDTIEEEILAKIENNPDMARESLNNTSFLQTNSNTGHQNQENIVSNADNEEDETMKQINEILDILYDKKVENLYDSVFLQKPLAKKLFIDGIDPKTLTSLPLQNRFLKTSGANKLLVFYPTYVTCEIFRTIKDNQDSRFYLTCCKGIGKSFSLALFVYLFRQKKNTRVFYMQNSAQFVSDSTICFVEELCRAFPNEIEALGSNSGELIDLLEKTPNLLPGSPLKIFLRKLLEKLKNDDTQVFVIFDQINEIQKIKPSSTREDGVLSWQIFQAMISLTLTKRSSILVSSPTNEMLTMKTEQEYPVYSLKMEQPPLEAVERYIEHRFKELLKDEEGDDKYKKVANLVQGYFLYIHEFAKTFEKGNSIDANIDQFRKNKITELKRESDKFFMAEDISIERDEICQKRRRFAVIILDSIINDKAFGDTLSEAHFDTRYLFKKSGKMQPLHPFVLEAYREIFTDPKLLDSMVRQFAKDAPVLGFILENIILVQWRKSGRDVVLTSFETFQETGEKINFSAYQEQDHCYPDSFELDKPGFYIPAIYNFALYDAFISEKSKVVALQIKKTFSKPKVDELILKTLKTDDPRKNTKDSVRKRLADILQKSKRSLETLLISVGQDPEKDQAFATLRQNREEARNFFYLDAVPILQALNLASDVIDIFKNSAVVDSA